MGKLAHLFFSFYRRVKRAVSLKTGILFSWRAKWSLCFCEVLGKNGPRFMVDNFGFRDASARLPRKSANTFGLVQVFSTSCEADSAGNYIDYGLWTISQIITCKIHSYIYLSYCMWNLSLHDLCIDLYRYILKGEDISYLFIASTTLPRNSPSAMLPHPSARAAKRTNSPSYDSTNTTED